MKIIKVNKKAMIYLSDGVTLTVDNFSQEDLDFTLNNTEEDIKERFIPKLHEVGEVKKKIKKLKAAVAASPTLEFSEGKYIIPSISNVSVPKNLVKKILKAEQNGDKDKVTAYLNFWVLNSQNPNEKARNNLMWFLEEHDFKILKSGLFVAYRNVVTATNNDLQLSEIQRDYVLERIHNIKKVQKKSLKNFHLYLTDTEINVMPGTREGFLTMAEVQDKLDYTETVTFTDQRTRSMTIQLGSPVRLDRSLCDEDSNKSCSRGLHLAKKDWSGLRSFGDTTLVCLCNPAHVVAVPKESTYGKIRTCEYFPLEIARFEDNKIVETIEDGDELVYFDISYDGLINDKEANEFQVVIPESVEVDLDFNKIKLSLEEIRKNIADKL